LVNFYDNCTNYKVTTHAMISYGKLTL